MVLEFGLNNREQGNHLVILSKSLEHLQGAAFQTFPNAVIHIPLINYDKRMPVQLVENIKLLNEIIQEMGIPLLQWQSFRMELDKIHWTTATAKAMFKHWMGHLNLP